MNNYTNNNINLITGGKNIPYLTRDNNYFNSYPFINRSENNSLNKILFPKNYQENLFNITSFILNSLLKENNLYKNSMNDNMPNNSIFKINNITINYKIKKNAKKDKFKNNNEDNKDKESIQKINKINVNPKNIINISTILVGEEKRTFVRVYPIPKKLSVYDIVKIFDKYLKTIPGKRIYNSIYLPLSKKIGKNIGYIFINLVSPKYVIQFYKIFNGFYFRFKNFQKPCFVVFADNQVIDTSDEDPRRRPIIFSDTIKDEKNEKFEDEK